MSYAGQKLDKAATKTGVYLFGGLVLIALVFSYWYYVLPVLALIVGLGISRYRRGR